MNKMLLEIPTHFETERLLLRWLRPGDGALYYAVGQRNRAHLARYESENMIMSIGSEQEAETMVRELQAEWVARKCFVLAAFERAAGEFVAQIYVGPVNWDLAEFEVGYFVDVDHEGRGYVTEAVRGTLGFLFEHLRAHRVSLRCDETNVRSRRVAEKCGMLLEGHLRENKRNPNGTITGTLCFGLLRSDLCLDP
jgi:aminoglycoside 6'-N-acetyltransferase